MVGPDQPAKLGSHSSNLPAGGREVLDCEVFFITLPNPEFNVTKLGTGSNFYIQKPLTVDGLARKVREVLDK